MTERRARTLGTVFALSWLGVLALYVQDIVSPHPQLKNVGTFLPLLLAYVAMYVVFWAWALYQPQLLTRAVLVLAMLVVNTVLVVVAGDPAGGLFFYTAVVAGAAFAWRFSAPAVILVALEVLVGQHASTNDWVRAGSTALQALLVGLGSVAVSLLIRTVVALREARDDLARMAVAEERIRFARDLHDLLGHSLSVVVLKSELAQSLLDREPEKARHELKEMERVARDALRDVREAVAGYRRTTLASELSGAREMLESAGIACLLHDELGQLSEGTETALAWAVREGATNVLRHSRARECSVRLTSAEGVAILEIADDGRGGEAKPGHGLTGLGERVRAIGGEVLAAPDAGRGFRLTVRVPT